MRRFSLRFGFLGALVFLVAGAHEQASASPYLAREIYLPDVSLVEGGDINNCSQIVGWGYPNGANSCKTFVWKNESHSYLPVPSGAPSNDMRGKAINDYGHVVGRGGDPNYWNTTTFGFIWDAVNSTRQIEPMLGLAHATPLSDINNQDDIIGTGVYSTFIRQGVAQIDSQYIYSALSPAGVLGVTKATSAYTAQYGILGSRRYIQCYLEELERRESVERYLVVPKSLRRWGTELG